MLGTKAKYMLCRDANAPKHVMKENISLLEHDTMQPGIKFLFSRDTGKVLLDYRVTSQNTAGLTATTAITTSLMIIHGLNQNFPDWCHRLYSSCGSAQHR